MTTDEAVDFIVAQMVEKRPDWTPDQIREMVELARPSIAFDPARFMDVYLDDLAELERKRGTS